MLRPVIERASRGIAFKRRLPARFARTPLYVSPDSQLKYLMPGNDAFDRTLLSMVDEQIRFDSIVWDVGANVGVLSFAAASVAGEGKVIAIEPDAWLARLLRRSAALKPNLRLNIDVLTCAISDRSGVARLLIAERGRASNALAIVGGRSQSGGVRKEQTVPALTLDALLDYFAPPTFVKIDIEGAEALALRGATRILREVRPTIYLEVGADTNDEVSAILRKWDYQLLDGDLLPAERRPLEQCTFNTLALPL